MKSVLKHTVCLLIILSGYSLWSQVGINTEDPQTMLDVNGDMALRAGVLSLNNGNNNLVSDEHSLFNITGPTDDFNINTIQPLADVDGQIITLVNTTPHTMTLVHNDGAGTNSIICTSNSDWAVKGIFTTVTLQYLKSLERWFVINYEDGQGYQRRIYSSVGTIDIATDSSDFSPMADLNINFTPKSTTVLVNISLAGEMDTIGSNDLPSQGYVDFRLVQTVGATSTVVAGFTTLATDVDFKSTTVTAWNSRMAMYPVAVTPGVATSFHVEWRRAGENAGILHCNPISSPTRCHSSITILD